MSDYAKEYLTKLRKENELKRKLQESEKNRKISDFLHSFVFPNGLRLHFEESRVVGPYCYNLIFNGREIAFFVERDQNGFHLKSGSTYGIRNLSHLADFLFNSNYLP